MKKILIVASALAIAGCAGQPLNLEATRALEAAVVAPPPAAQCDRAQRTKFALEQYRASGGNDPRVTADEAAVDEILDRCYPATSD